MHGFNPKEFLQMLRAYQAPNVPAAKMPSDPVAPSRAAAVAPAVAEKKEPVALQPNIGPAAAVRLPSSSADDIVINLRGSKDKPKAGGLFGGKSEKKPGHASEAPKPKTGLFGKKKNEPRPLMMGAAAEPQSSAPPKQSAMPETKPQAPQAPYVPYAADSADEVTQFEGDGSTQLEGAIAKLRLVSEAQLPAEIVVDCSQERPFVIGRFDITAGRQQSDFEFDKSTRAVSRRHAAIERIASGYVIIDLSSSAGTFVNGQKIPPNVPRELTFGTRVSFGTSGADYIFEGGRR
jgi:pSer/pThr/pTyr-binding forkhead associated (FHA) protein